MSQNHKSLKDLRHFDIEISRVLKIVRSHYFENEQSRINNYVIEQFKINGTLGSKYRFIKLSSIKYLKANCLMHFCIMMQGIESPFYKRTRPNFIQNFADKIFNKIFCSRTDFGDRLQ